MWQAEQFHTFATPGLAAVCASDFQCQVNPPPAPGDSNCWCCSGPVPQTSTIATPPATGKTTHGPPPTITTKSKRLSTTIPAKKPMNTHKPCKQDSDCPNGNTPPGSGVEHFFNGVCVLCYDSCLYASVCQTFASPSFAAVCTSDVQCEANPPPPGDSNCWCCSA
ncbi:9449_t:CDS:2 [Dentiscutata heterogama]|uniref:9449_t:CDS:1 n=1 Tax=Dentiscutata heterogama TaxID=1316150 RepID=A0ACA9K3U6_9GLOM|nr:9449_t:CDS:2 [Dentiscutata heterogama]